MQYSTVIRNAQDLLQDSTLVDKLVLIFHLLDRDIYTASATMTRIEAEMGRTYAALQWNGTFGWVVGAMVLRESFPWRRTLEIEKIAVSKEYQRQGIGKSLLEHATTLAMRDHYECLEVVSHKDYKAEGFYEKCGFVKTYSDERCVGLRYNLHTPRT